MSLIDHLLGSQIVTDTILGFLDAKSLAYFGSTSKDCRRLVNSNILWHRLCRLKDYVKFEYLLDKPTHQAIIPKISSTPLPSYIEHDNTDLERLCQWRQVYNRSEHLIRNWSSGIYYVLPLLKGHKGNISAFDCDDSFIVSGGQDDKMLKVWSVEELECVNSFKVKSDSINCLSIYNDLIITAGDAGNVKMFERDSGDLKHILSCNFADGSVNKLLVTANKLVAVYNDKAIRVWCLKDLKLNFILRGHFDDIECIAHHENLLLSGSWDKLIIIWDLNTGAKLATLEGHTEVVNCIKMKSIDFVASASADASVIIWNLSVKNSPIDSKSNRTKTSITLFDSVSLHGHESDVYCVEICGEYLASGGADSLVIIWNTSGDLLYKLSGHLGIVRFLFMDDHKLVSAGDAKKILVWNYQAGKLCNTLYRNPNRVSIMHVTHTQIMTVSPEADSAITVISYW